MIYHILKYINFFYKIPYFYFIKSIFFRSFLSFILSLYISLYFGKKIIFFLKKNKITESIRNLGLIGQKEKEGTPTMGGIIIIISILIPVLLFSDLKNFFIQNLIFTILYMGGVGLFDDYIKVFKKNKKGIKIKTKIIFQILFGIIIGFNFILNEKKIIKYNNILHFSLKKINNIKTTFPIFKKNEFDYSLILKKINKNWNQYSYITFIFSIIIIIIFSCNGSNLTDGIDGLNISISLIIIFTLILLIFFSSNRLFSEYLHIMYIYNSSELIIFSLSLIGSFIGFLWYNTYPAQIFMGDTGSLSIGAIISVLSICIKKELILPFICIIFFIENISVLIQMIYLKYSKNKLGISKKIFLMTPLHHHFQKKKYHESKIFIRFCIIQLIMSILIIFLFKKN